LSRARSASVTWLALAVFSLAGVNLGRAAYTLSQWPLLASLDLPTPLALSVVLGGLWGGILLAAAWGLWRLRAWGRRLTLIAFPIYQAWVVIWQFVFARADYARGRLLFVVVASLALTAVVVWPLTRPHVREAFNCGPTPGTDTSA
jgi:uncharacterized membrane protein (DUF2068 family)